MYKCQKRIVKKTKYLDYSTLPYLDKTSVLVLDLLEGLSPVT